MKITEESKIKEILKGLIPEGYKFQSGEFISFIRIDENTGYIRIDVKKKEAKDFEWYVNEYFKTEFASLHTDTIEFIIDNNFEEIPFEMRLGLLKFICNKLHLNLLPCIGMRYETGVFYKEITDFCPEEFLDSILK